MSMSVDGLVSGMDTTNLVAQLLQAEAAPQAALRAKLTAAKDTASAYRTVNTVFAAVRAAAESLTTGSLTGGRKVLSDNSTVSASASAAAVTGTGLTFSVETLAATHNVLSGTSWTSTTADMRTDGNGDPMEPAWPIEIFEADGVTSRGTVSVPAGVATFSLAEAAKAINDKKLGVRATIVSLSPTDHRLQLTSEASGDASVFIVKSDTETDADGNVGSGFTATRTGADATLSLGVGVTARSATNTFTDIMPGVTVTVSKDDGASTTITVGSDADAVATKMQALVDAANAALAEVKRATSNAPGSLATLRGDFSVTSLAGRLLDAVSTGVGADGSPAKIGLQLNKDGTIKFDRAKFSTALKDTPELAQRMVSGRAASFGPNGVAGGGDDVVAVTGVAQRLFDVAKSASDTATGSLMSLAKGQESMVKDIQTRIEAWDLRLAKRKETLTRQFTAMETALSSLRNQSTWLAGQINSLPS